MKTKELTEVKKFIIKTFGELYANGAVAIRAAVFFEKAKRQEFTMAVMASR